MLIILSQSHGSPGRRDRVSLLSRPCGPRVREWQFPEQGVGSVAEEREADTMQANPAKACHDFATRKLVSLLLPSTEPRGRKPKPSST